MDSAKRQKLCDDAQSLLEADCLAHGIELTGQNLDCWQSLSAASMGSDSLGGGDMLVEDCVPPLDLMLCLEANDTVLNYPQDNDSLSREVMDCKMDSVCFSLDCDLLVQV